LRVVIIKKEQKMTYRNVLTVGAVLSILVGLGFLLMPGRLVSFYNLELTPPGLLVGQLYGATLLGFGLLNWFGREFADGSVRRELLTADLLTAAIAFVVSLIGQLGGVPEVNALGWSTVLLYLLLGIGFAYLRFMKG